jgi:hypothetical protein
MLDIQGEQHLNMLTVERHQKIAYNFQFILKGLLSTCSDAVPLEYPT